MNNKNISSGKLKERAAPAGEATASSHEVAEVKAQMLEMQMKIDILKETIHVLKKSPASIKQPSTIERKQ